VTGFKLSRFQLDYYRVLATEFKPRIVYSLSRLEKFCISSQTAQEVHVLSNGVPITQSICNETMLKYLVRYLPIMLSYYKGQEYEVTTINDFKKCSTWIHLRLAITQSMLIIIINKYNNSLIFWRNILYCFSSTICRLLLSVWNKNKANNILTI